LLLAFASQKIVHNVRDEMAGFVVPLRKEKNYSRTMQNRKKYKGPPEKDLQKGKKRNEYLFLREHTNKLTEKRTCTSEVSHFEQQHNLKSTCHSGHFHCARWRIPPQEYVLANKNCSRSS